LRASPTSRTSGRCPTRRNTRLREGRLPKGRRRQTAKRDQRAFRQYHRPAALMSVQAEKSLCRSLRGNGSDTTAGRLFKSRLPGDEGFTASMAPCHRVRGRLCPNGKR
jgi:hypothetical protein